MGRNDHSYTISPVSQKALEKIVNTTLTTTNIHIEHNTHEPGLAILNLEKSTARARGETP